MPSITPTTVEQSGVFTVVNMVIPLPLERLTDQRLIELAAKELPDLPCAWAFVKSLPKQSNDDARTEVAVHFFPLGMPVIRVSRRKMKWIDIPQ